MFFNRRRAYHAKRGFDKHSHIADQVLRLPDTYSPGKRHALYMRKAFKFQSASKTFRGWW